MHPELHYQLMQTRVADLHAQARRDALVRAARPARRPPPRRVLRLPAAVTRRLRAVLGAHSA
jgi:hypothetical protein